MGERMKLWRLVYEWMERTRALSFFPFSRKVGTGAPLAFPIARLPVLNAGPCIRQSQISERRLISAPRGLQRTSRVDSHVPCMQRYAPSGT